MVWLVPASIILTMFNLGMSALVARVAVPFRDVNNLVPYIVRLWLYLSPVIYPVTFLEQNLSGPLQVALKANPLFPMLALFRHALMGLPMGADDVLTATAWALSTMVIGVGAFVRYESRMTRYL
jgi:teichoic acid transport system permease protein